MKKIICFIVLCAFLMQCKSEKGREGKVDFSFQRLTSDPVSGVVRSYSIVPLETTEHAYITRIAKVTVHEDKMFILEYVGPRRNLYVFSKEGKFISKLDAQGGGPREYQSMTDFDIHPVHEYISVLDPGLRKIKNYDFNSNYIGEQAFDSWGKEFKYFFDGDNVYTVISTKASKMTEQGNSYDIEVYNEKGELVYSALPFQKAVSMGAGTPTSMFRLNKAFHYRQINTNLVYSIRADTIRQVYTLDFPYPVMPGDELENAFLKGKKIFDKYVYLVNYFESEKMILCQFTHDKKPYWGLYDKKSNQSKVFNGEIDPSCGCDGSFMVLGVWEKGFVIETDYSKISRLLESFDPKKEKCSNPEVFDTVDKLDMTSNPILLFVEFKV